MSVRVALAVAVSEGVKVGAGVEVLYGVDVADGGSVRVGGRVSAAVGERVGAGDLPGPQAEKDRLEKRKKATRMAWFVLIGVFIRWRNYWSYILDIQARLYFKR